MRKKTATMSEVLKQAVREQVAAGEPAMSIAARAGIGQGQLSRFLSTGDGHRDLRLASADKLAIALGLVLRPAE